MVIDKEEKHRSYPENIINEKEKKRGAGRLTWEGKCGYLAFGRNRKTLQRGKRWGTAKVKTGGQLVGVKKRAWQWATAQRRKKEKVPPTI